ncbi:D-glucuronyl C5-epimerase family protein [Pseudomonas putida]|uniref:D-glucuronyl C5-epimerase family protein n=1 Tax=Pseudomonas putida TaxID=303 RepID=UPI00300F7804
MKVPALFMVCVALAAPIHVSASSRNLASGTDLELGPFLWSRMDLKDFNENDLRQAVAKKDPLRPFSVAFRLLVNHERTGDQKSLDDARKVLDYMLDDYQPATREPEGVRWFYGFDYDRGIKAPWWSGMDGLFGPMTLFAGWQATGDERYRNAALKSAKLMLRPPSEGGVLWRDGENCWISEYSWKGMTREKEYYVMNGHLWGLQALYMLAEASGDEKFKEAYQCARKGTINRLSDFYNSSGNWTWYHLAPRVINATHYNTLESAQFKAMAAVTGDDVYVEPGRRRAEFFKNAYPLHLVKTGAGLQVQFSMLGAPNAYWTDTYPVTVSCKVGGKTVTKTNSDAYNKKIPMHERMVLRLPVSKTPEQCSVSVRSNVEVKMYKQDKFKLIKDIKEDRFDVAPVASLQGELLQNNDVYITPNKGEGAAPGEARVSFEVGRDVSALDKIAMVVSSTGDSALGIILVGENGTRATSYYPVLKAGRENIVIVNKLGFEKGDELDSRIKSITLRLYTKANSESFKINIKEASIIRNPVNLEAFLKRNETAYFPQQ